MFHSIILAQILGLYLFIISILMLARPGHFRDVVDNLKPESGALLVGGALSLLFGLMLIVIHNIWIWDFKVLVTVIAYITVIKSIMILAFPAKVIELTQKCYSGMGYYASCVISLIVGFILIGEGFCPLYSQFCH
jgi:uncharacterized membrane protein